MVLIKSMNYSGLLETFKTLHISFIPWITSVAQIVYEYSDN